VGEKFICTGPLLYEIRPQNKVMRIHELPPPQAGKVADDNFLSFLFGMKAEEAKRRYDLTLVKEDQWYVYLEIVPKLPADKADFQRARMVLNNKTFLPRELWFEQPNGNETKWDIPEIRSGAPLKNSDFAPPTPPKDWNVVRVPRPEAVPPRTDVPPRVVRPAN
jgi:TIGR03009 family protein